MGKSTPHHPFRFSQGTHFWHRNFSLALSNNSYPQLGHNLPTPPPPVENTAVGLNIKPICAAASLTGHPTCPPRPGVFEVMNEVERAGAARLLLEGVPTFQDDYRLLVAVSRLVGNLATQGVCPHSRDLGVGSMVYVRDRKGSDPDKNEIIMKTTETKHCRISVCVAQHPC